jgi:hypothetical protein
LFAHCKQQTDLIHKGNKTITEFFNNVWTQSHIFSFCCCYILIISGGAKSITVDRYVGSWHMAGITILDSSCSWMPIQQTDLFIPLSIYFCYSYLISLKFSVHLWLICHNGIWEEVRYILLRCDSMHEFLHCLLLALWHGNNPNTVTTVMY